MAQCGGRTIEQGNIETITPKTVKGHRIGKHWKCGSNVELGGTGRNIRNIRARSEQKYGI